MGQYNSMAQAPESLVAKGVITRSEHNQVRKAYRKRFKARGDVPLKFLREQRRRGAHNHTTTETQKPRGDQEALQPIQQYRQDNNFLGIPLHARRGFWHRLFLGEATIDDATKKRYLEPSAEEVDYATASALCDQTLLEISERLSFFWMPEDEVYHAIFCHDALHALHYIDRTIFESFIEHENGDLHAYTDSWFGHIGLSSAYLYHLLSPESPARPGNWNPANMCLQLALAYNICHELAYAIFRWRDGVGGIAEPEPYVFLKDPMPETGKSWNYFFSGGILELPLYPEWFGYMTNRSWNYIHATPGLSAIVDMPWIEEWFLKEMWVHKIPLGTAPSTDRPTCPKLWITDRLVELEEIASLRPVLYRDGKTVASCYGHDTEDFDHGGLSKPGFLESWFYETSKR
ncbi:hypothetical protein BU23DRAFT_642116 [Bimuria novae-zelandiae CBS 107.79]|uniref:Uncharacterized protein n=1 Tax=Bimuria novae-zelandiae CBS 107.79 TaxID=1447943 RepID=A0A6A5VRC2_9PLEO|nr:hypothetical protein BU23DRAFT_642116 [Bimuria novae-zelandiae CBS 107.79]